MKTRSHYHFTPIKYQVLWVTFFVSCLSHRVAAQEYLSIVKQQGDISYSADKKNWSSTSGRSQVPVTGTIMVKTGSSITLCRKGCEPHPFNRQGDYELKEEFEGCTGQSFFSRLWTFLWGGVTGQEEGPQTTMSTKGGGLFYETPMLFPADSETVLSKNITFTWLRSSTFV